jgi:hypothetical protein
LPVQPFPEGLQQRDRLLLTQPQPQRLEIRPRQLLLFRLLGRITAPATAGTPPPVVILAGTTKQPIVRGTPKPVLRHAQYHVVKALLDAGETGLTVDQLVHHSGHTDARGILKRLAESGEGWRSVLHFPGRAGGHSRIG